MPLKKFKSSGGKIKNQHDMLQSAFVINCLHI